MYLSGHGCRSCGASISVGFHHLDQSYLNKPLTDIFYECTNVNVRLDHFSRNLCDGCFKLLISFYEFRLQTQDINAKLSKDTILPVKEEIIDDSENALVDNIEIEVKPFDVTLQDWNDPTDASYNSEESTTQQFKLKNEYPIWAGYKCVGCKASFKFLTELAHHLKTTKDEQHLWICDICSKSHGNKNQLIQHIRRLHKEVECKCCNEKFVGFDLLTKHNRKMHRNEKQAVCPQCGKFFLDKRGLNVHIKGVHEKQMNYSCHYCGKKAFSKINLISHFRTHTDERPYHCDVADCGKRFKQICQLKAHSLTHITEQNYSCEVCGIKVKSKYYLHEHKKLHISTEVYKCDLCESTFARPNYLKDHKRKQHTLQIPAPCPECGKIFKSQKTLSVHMSYHRETDHICHICNRMFARKILLDHHISATHEKNRKWVCSFPNCDKAYLRCSHLRHHERVVHYNTQTANISVSYST